MWTMQIYRVETTIWKGGTLTIKGLPFKAGDKVEVVVRSREQKRELSESYPLRGKPVRYADPFGTVAEGDWNPLE